MTLGVLITYYGERELLSECLGSLFSGEQTPDETIVYDDASDAPPDQFIPSGLPVRVIRGTVNRGPARGRNVLLHAACSEYVHFHDSDDLFHPSWCQSVTKAIRQSSPDAVFTEISSQRSGRVQSERILGLKLLDGGDLTRSFIHGAILPAAATCRRSAALAIGGYRENLWQSEDWDFHVRLAASGICYEIIDEPLVTIRIREESRSQNQIEVWTGALEAICSLAGELDPRYRGDLAEKAAQAGSILFKAGAREQARRAFRAARDLGPPKYDQQRPIYGFIAQAFGPEIAERFGMLYRNLFFEAGRRYLATLGL